MGQTTASRPFRSGCPSSFATALLREGLVPHARGWFRTRVCVSDSTAACSSQVGIEDCLHIEFEYSKSKYHLKDVVVGKIFFLLVRIKIKHMEIEIRRRESTGSGANTYAHLKSPPPRSSPAHQLRSCAPLDIVPRASVAERRTPCGRIASDCYCLAVRMRSVCHAGTMRATPSPSTRSWTARPFEVWPHHLTTNPDSYPGLVNQNPYRGLFHT